MIRILDNNLINKIAAGEVVERPESVVKELVENSLDAGADFISVEIKNGGMDVIEVADNGKGMSKEDAALCVERHATSKIEKIEDLNNIMSFGFRGEALAAISAISKFSLQTKEKGAVSGIVLCRRRSSSTAWSPSIECAEKEWETQGIGCSEGTKIKVEDIFYNVPARRKFLKTVQTEFNHILNTLADIALANPEVRFRFSHNGRVIFDYLVSADGLTRINNATPARASFNSDFQKDDDYLAKSSFLNDEVGGGQGFSPQSSQLSNGTMSDGARRSTDGWAERVKDVLGSDNFSNMAEFYREAGDMVLSGFVSSPATARSVKGQQYLFVNNRPVNNNIVHKAIYNGYKNLIPVGSHPSFVIKLDLEPELVDVNVHPRKMEVRFLHQQDVFKTVEAVVREAVNRRIKNQELRIKNGEREKSKFEIRNKSQIQNFKFQNNCPNEQRTLIERRKPLNSCLAAPVTDRDGSKACSPLWQRGVRRGIGASQLQSFNDAMFRVHDGSDKQEEMSWKLIGQVKDLYLVVEAKDSFILIDQHAAHERIIYDKIIEKMENDTYKAQTLLAPLNIELTLGEFETVKNNFEFLKKIGFEAEEFGENCIIIRAVPQDIAGKDIVNIIKEIIGDFIIAGKDDLDGDEDALKRVRNKIVCYIACRSAVKQGDKLSLDEQMDLVKKVISGEVKDTCPHGRPIKAKLRWDEIGKKFKRIN